MTWGGEIRILGSGRMVRLGEAVVPAKAEFHLAGSEGAPDAAVRFEVRDGRPECVEVVIRSKPDGRGVRSTDTGAISIDKLMAHVFGVLGFPDESAAAGGATYLPSERDWWAVRGAVADARARRSRGPSREYLEKVAEIYRDNLSGKPAAAVAKMLGLSQRTAARRIAEAREAGLLPATTRGKKKA